MNTLKAGATYVGEGTTEHGIRYVEVAVPAVGKGEDVMVRIIHQSSRRCTELLY